MTEPITPEQARKVLEQVERERLAEFQVELDALLAKYGYQFRPYPVVTPDGRIEAAIEVVPRAA